MIACILLLIEPVSAESGNRITFVRDAETENSIISYARPLFIAAGLNPDSVKIYLILNPQLNAFVSGGQNIYIHTGLLSSAENVGQIIGVLAHETGHIAGGHLVRAAIAIDEAKNIDMISKVLGIGVSIFSKDPNVAVAAIAGAPDIGTRTFLKFNRTQESSADHAALKMMEDTGQSAQGMYEFMEKIENQELMSVARQDPYLRTHPMSRERLEAIADHLRGSAYTETPYPEELQRQHDRIRAKIIAFTYPLALVLRQYPLADKSVAARYARAFAYYRLPDLKTALEIINSLLDDYPEDPYFHELKAQMLFENGYVFKAIKSYTTAVKFAPPSDVLFMELAQAQLSSDDDAFLAQAEANFLRSLSIRRDQAFTWRQLAIAYGRQNKMGLYHLALGEEALLKRIVTEALDHAKKAEGFFPSGSKEWLQAQDISTAARNIK